MTRIYFKPQGASTRAGSGRARKSTAKGTHGQHHLQHRESDDAHRDDDDDGWRSKLEPNAIEQIADGLEKMVLSWTHQPQKVQNSEPDFNLAQARGDAHSLLSSDAIKSATMEIVEDGDQFSIGTKETTISFVHLHDHHNHHQGFKPALPSHHQQTLITVGDDDDDGLIMQDITKGDILSNSLLSIQNGECGSVDYHQMNSAVGATSALWYLTPTLALPNTLSYGKDCTKTQQKCQDFQADMGMDGDDIGHCNGNGDLPEHIPKGLHWNCDVLGDKETKATGVCELDREKLQVDSAVVQKIACKLETIGSKSWSEMVEINGGTKIKDLLGKKLAALGNGFLSSEGIGNLNAEYYKKKVEELQIALLECAMEYEVKIVEMKMKALHSKPHEQHQTEPAKDYKNREESENGHSESLKGKRDAQRVEYLKKQLSRLQREKAVAAQELSDLRKRERQFDLQRRSLDDALSRVNLLQSELARKEQDIVDCRLREKEAKAQLYELQLGLQKAQAAQIEPRKLLTLLPALKDWIQSNKKVPQEFVRADYPTERADHIPQIDNIVCAITKEIQMLQNALSHVINKK